MSVNMHSDTVTNYAMYVMRNHEAIRQGCNTRRSVVCSGQDFSLICRYCECGYEYICYLAEWCGASTLRRQRNGSESPGPLVARSSDFGLLDRLSPIPQSLRSSD